MGTLKSSLQSDSADFARNATAMQELVDDLRSKVAQIRAGGGKRAREKHLARGKLLPRERIRQLLDGGSPFLEFSQFAAWQIYGGEVPAAGLICGTGPRMLWMWPNARISVMGGAQAAGVLVQIKRDGLEARGENWSAEDEQAFRRLGAEVSGQPLNAELIADTAERICVMRAGAEGREGLSAFLEKRRPAWVKG